MRKSLVLWAVLLCPLVAPLWLSFAQEATKSPENVVFQAKNGNVTFDHKKHLDRQKGDCKICHAKAFPESKAPIDFKVNMHRAAEAAKTACAVCHVEGGPAFASKGNCGKCHVKPAAATT